MLAPWGLSLYLQPLFDDFLATLHHIAIVPHHFPLVLMWLQTLLEPRNLASYMCSFPSDANSSFAHLYGGLSNLIASSAT